MGFISLRIKPSTSSGPVVKNESEQFNQYMRNESEKKVAIREQEHAEPRRPLYLFFLSVLLIHHMMVLGLVMTGSFSIKIYILFLYGLFRCDEPVGVC